MLEYKTAPVGEVLLIKIDEEIVPAASTAIAPPYWFAKLFKKVQLSTEKLAVENIAPPRGFAEVEATLIPLLSMNLEFIITVFLALDSIAIAAPTSAQVFSVKLQLSITIFAAYNATAPPSPASDDVLPTTKLLLKLELLIKPSEPRQ